MGWEEASVHHEHKYEDTLQCIVLYYIHTIFITSRLVREIDFISTTWPPGPILSVHLPKPDNERHDTSENSKAAVNA